MTRDLGIARRDQIFGGRKKYGHESTGDEIVEFLLGLGEIFRRLRGRNDREVIADFRVVENSFVRLYPFAVENLRCKWIVIIAFTEGFQRLSHRGQIIFWQMTRIRTRIGQHLVPLVQCLCQTQCVFGRKTKAGIGFTLQAGQVKQCRRHRCAGPRLFGDYTCLASTCGDDGLGSCFAPQAFCALFRIGFIFFEFGVQPASFIHTSGTNEFGPDLPVIPGHESFDFFFALDNDGKCRRLHTTDGRQIKTAFFGIEGSHRAGAIDTDQPVGFAAATRGIGERQHVGVVAQMLEGIADCALSHRLQPQAFDGLLGFRVLNNQPEDQFALASRVTGIDDCTDIFALEQFVQQLQARFGFLYGIEREIRWNHRQVGK